MAIDLYEGKLNDKKITENFFICSNYSWNFQVTEEEPHLDILQEAFKYATVKIIDKGENTVIQFQKFKESNNLFGKNNDDILQPHQDDDICLEEDGDFSTFMQIIGSGIELFTVGFL